MGGICQVTNKVNLKLVIILAVLSVETTQTSEVNPGACPAGWYQGQGACYINLVSEPRRRSWQNATSTCRELGGHLATPNSAVENEFIWGLFLASFPSDTKPLAGLWIGCTAGAINNDNYDSGVDWQCIGDTTEVMYRATWWIEDHRANCAVTRKSIWIKQWCTSSKYVMCEKRLLSVAIRSTTCSVATTGRCLQNHSFMTVEVKGKLQCCLACYKDQRCRSFNLKEDKLCELFGVGYEEQYLASGECVVYTI